MSSSKQGVEYFSHLQHVYTRGGFSVHWAYVSEGFPEETDEILICSPLAGVWNGIIVILKVFTFKETLFSNVVCF